MIILKKGKKVISEKKRLEYITAREFKCENCGCIFKLDRKDALELESTYKIDGREFCQIYCPWCSKFVSSTKFRFSEVLE